jgi:capsular polysaccharide transport system permease protein
LRAIAQIIIFAYIKSILLLDDNMSADAPSLEAVSTKDKSAQKIHVLNDGELQRRSHRAQRFRRIVTVLSFVLCVIVPAGFVAYYYQAVSVDRYVVESKFAIKSPGASAPTDLLGIVSSVSTASSTVSDSYMIVDFIESRDLVDRLEARLDLRAMYSQTTIDPLMRLDTDSTKEDVVKYLSRVISVYYDTSSQILTLQVQAFTPEDAQRISTAILNICDELVNTISERARNDTMRSAEGEVTRVELLLAAHREKISAFRQTQQEVDPTAAVGQQIQLLGSLEGKLAAARAQLGALEGVLNNDSPSVKSLNRQISAMGQELQSQRARMGSGTQDVGATQGAVPTLTSQIGVYEDLIVDLDFLQRAYFTALASREAARIEADRMQRYLAAFVQPSLPEKSLYPKRTSNILIFIAFATMLWSIGVMLVYVVREHSS